MPLLPHMRPDCQPAPENDGPFVVGFLSLLLLPLPMAKLGKRLGRVCGQGMVSRVDSNDTKARSRIFERLPRRKTKEEDLHTLEWHGNLGSKGGEVGWPVAPTWNSRLGAVQR
jgi:hypothetical protein